MEFVGEHIRRWKDTTASKSDGEWVSIRLGTHRTSVPVADDLAAAQSEAPRRVAAGCNTPANPADAFDGRME